MLFSSLTVLFAMGAVVLAAPYGAPDGVNVTAIEAVSTTKAIELSPSPLNVAASTGVNVPDVANTPDSSVSFFNSTTDIFGAVADEDNYISIEMSGTRQHVGQFIGARMYNEMYHMLWRACNEDSWETNTCFLFPSGDNIKNVEYNAKGKLATNSKLHVTVMDSYWPESNVIRDALMDAIASTYRAMTDQPENCATLKLSGKDTYHCQVGSQVEIKFKSGKVQGHMGVLLQFNSKTGPKWYQCERPVLTASTRTALYSRVVPALKQALPDAQFNSAYSYCGES